MTADPFYKSGPYGIKKVNRLLVVRRDLEKALQLAFRSFDHIHIDEKLGEHDTDLRVRWVEPDSTLHFGLGLMALFLVGRQGFSVIGVIKGVLRIVMHGPRQETCRGGKVAVRKVAHAKFEAFQRD